MPPPVWKRTYMPLPSKFWPSPGEPDERVEELLVVLHAGRELVLDHDVAGRQDHVGRAARREVGLRQQLDRAVGQLREVARWRAPARSRGRRAPSRPISGRAWSIHGNAASIVAGVSRTPGRISRANARVGGNASLSDASARLALSSVARQLADRGAAGCPPRTRTRAIVALKLVIRPCSAFSLRISAPRGAGGAVDQPREVRLGLDAQERLEYLRRSSARPPGCRRRRR